MTMASACGRANGTTRLDGVGAVALSAADWLRLAAAPTFAVMALATGFDSGGAPRWVCSAAQGDWPLGGMALMYALMCVIHSPPWLTAIFGRRPAPASPDPPHDRDRGRRDEMARSFTCEN